VRISELFFDATLNQRSLLKDVWSRLRRRCRNFSPSDTERKFYKRNSALLFERFWATGCVNS
jgi:hypothetical protein